MLEHKNICLHVSVSYSSVGDEFYASKIFNVPITCNLTEMLILFQ